MTGDNHTKANPRFESICGEENRELSECTDDFSGVRRGDGGSVSLINDDGNILRDSGAGGAEIVNALDVDASRRGRTSSGERERSLTTSDTM